MKQCDTILKSNFMSEPLSYINCTNCFTSKSAYRIRSEGCHAPNSSIYHAHKGKRLKRSFPKLFQAEILRNACALYSFNSYESWNKYTLQFSTRTFFNSLVDDVHHLFLYICHRLRIPHVGWRENILYALAFAAEAISHLFWSIPREPEPAGWPLMFYFSIYILAHRISIV